MSSICEFLVHYLVVAGIFVVVDAVWLKFIANKLYKKELGGLLLAKPNMLPAVVFYLLYVFGIVIFALNPALSADNGWAYAIGHGALLGLLMYATYDLTNLATLKGWSAKITLVDMVWGAFVTGAASTLAFIIFN